jgi:RNA polymerase-binding protein DksA
VRVSRTGGAVRRAVAAASGLARRTADASPARKSAQKAATRAVAQKAPANRALAKKAAVKTAVAQRGPAKKGPAKKALPKKAVVKTAVAKKTVAKKTVAKKTVAKQAPAKKVAVARATKAPAKKAPAKTPLAAKVVAKKTPAPKVAPGKALASPATAAKTAEKLPARTSPPNKSAAPATPPALVVRADEDPWTRKELAEVRAELEDEVRRLHVELDVAEHDIDDMLRDAGDGAGDDPADAGSKTFEREHEMSLANNTRDMLTQAERALARIDNRTYGICENCGNPIGKARLQVFPRATLCMTCKQREERR